MGKIANGHSGNGTIGTSSNGSCQTNSNGTHYQMNGDPTQKVEKWLDRHADDPEDYEHACRVLCRSMYDANEPDFDLDQTLLRSKPVDLYRYLKHHLWYLVHTNQLDQNEADDILESIRTPETTSAKKILKKLAECVLGLSLPVLSTVYFQANEPFCRRSLLILSTMTIYGILYALLRYYKGFLQPSSSSWVIAAEKKQKAKTTTELNYLIVCCATKSKDNVAIAANVAEWRSRILAITNALILIVGSGFCFTEWISTYDPPSEGWVMTLPLQCSGNESTCSCFSSYPITFASLFVGYLQWDLCWLIWHRDTHHDVGTMIHHAIFIGVTQFVLSDTYFRKPFAWLSFTELSTPFLHFRWILAATGRKDDPFYFWSSLGFALTFLSTRTVGYGLGLIDVWRNRESWEKIPGLWGVVVGLHLAYLLNLFWSWKVGSALVRTLSKSINRGRSKRKPQWFLQVENRCRLPHIHKETDPSSLLVQKLIRRGFGYQKGANISVQSFLKCRRT